MDVKIGLTQTSRELQVTPVDSADAVADAVETAIRDQSTLTLTDDKGRRYVVDGAKISYVEIGADDRRRVGFIAE